MLVLLSNQNRLPFNFESDSLFGVILYSIIFAAIVAEAIFDRLHKGNRYSRRESATNVFMFFVYLSVAALMQGIFIAVFFFITDYSLVNTSLRWYWWVLCFVWCDFNAYWFHYISHKWRVLWAMHVVHHSGDKMNLTTALRLPLLHNFFRLFIHTPVVFFGLPPEMVLLVNSLSGFWSVFYHTEAKVSLGVLGYILVTPSHHRVHHASNPEYLDKNYGQVFIFWDRLFGTFQGEDQKPVYGLTIPLRSYNPVRISFHEWASLYKDIRNVSCWKQAFKLLYKPPGWKG
jgi:sterol desaturase/sphingolipid hydroxylase (fatty acid hydroxylase superfamily)